ncbi:MAG: twin-arginine translocase TatA/TatE family subunit [Muribaculaceae bacterium]|nr:twin-arginine translocase TatA/TatE family subunit [Muribaculaceae bacterium]HAP49851.1 twin-arginine translocase TatA/TatE family subunit [Porphyromonadaceae bacterium]
MLNLVPLFLNLGTGEIVIIVFVILLLFGGKKIPELMRGMGKGVRSFKDGMNEVEQELKKPLQDDDKPEQNA